MLEVWDAGRTPPRLKAAGPDDEGGRGLWLVNALADRWGCRYPVTGGKIVWCAFGSVPEASGGVSLPRRGG